MTIERLCCTALVAGLFSAPCFAQEMPTMAELTELAMEVCVREAPAGEDSVDPGHGFVQTSFEGDVATYEHPAGPLLTLVGRPDFFSCELSLPGAPAGTFESMLAEFEPAMGERFAAIEPERTDTGMVWQGTSEAGLPVETRLEQTEDGSLRLASTAGTDEADEAPSN